MAARGGPLLLGVIVNADDFGFHDAANRGIVRAFEEGLISSTTLMANQPGSEEAVALAYDHGLDEHLGIHLVLTQGVPLTDAIRRLPRFCDSEGVFRDRRSTSRVWHLGGAEREAVITELAAQVRKVRDAGFRVTHIDSHHSVHHDWAIGTCVIQIARELDIPFVRLARNCGPGTGLASSVYERTYNLRLRRSGLARTRWFGEPGDWLDLRERGTDPTLLDDFELMTHPQLEDGNLIDAVHGVLLSEFLAPVVGVSRATSFSGARRVPA